MAGYITAVGRQSVEKSLRRISSTNYSACGEAERLKEVTSINMTGEELNT